MSAVVSRVVDADNHIFRQQPLNPEIPLIDLSVACSFGPLIVVVVITPFSEFSVLLPLRDGQTCGKRVLKRGVLCLKTIQSKTNGCACGEGWPGILKVRSDAHSVIYARPG